MFDSLTVWTLEELALFQFVPQCLINNFSFWVVINMGTLQVPHHYTECLFACPQLLFTTKNENTKSIRELVGLEYYTRQELTFNWYN